MERRGFTACKTEACVPARTAYLFHGRLHGPGRPRVGAFLQTGPDGDAGQPCRLINLADPPSSKGTGFYSSPEADKRMYGVSQ